MTAVTLVTFALSLSLAQATGHEAPGQAAPALEQLPPGHPPVPAEMERHGDAAAHDEAAAAGHEEHAAAEGGHGEAAEGGHEKAGLSESLMHHVTDGYLIEFPGKCHGEWAWSCEIDLKEEFGDKLVFFVGGTKIDMTPTKHLIMMWSASLLLLISFVVGLRKKAVVPRGFYNFLEMLVQFVRNIALENIGKKDGDRFVPYLVTAFFFIFFVNLFGLIPYAATATGNLAVTLALALFTFVITQYAAIKAMGLGAWLKHLTGGVAVWLWPIMVPVEILGLFTKPFALTVRLFANMLAGHIVILSLLGLIYALGSQWVALGSVPMALGIFMLELFVGFVQAYIFTMLSAVFIGAGVVHHGHDEEHGHSEEHHGSHVAGASPSHG